MYFTTLPKEKKEDFFNYNYEYDELKKALDRRDRIMAVLGVRRVGKTSLLNIIYNEVSGLKLWIDGRIVSNPKKELFSAIFEVVKSGKSQIFGNIESLNISAFGIGLDIKIASESLIEIEKKIRSGGKICVFIDEAQRMNRGDLADVLSYFYDRFPDVSFIISGSEIGLLENVIGEYDAGHPLYGRYIAKILMNRLDKNQAQDFLTAGFGQLGVVPEKGEFEEVISQLDGLIGWLTLYGYERCVVKSASPLEKTVEVAARIVASELTSFFKTIRNKALYLAILNNSGGITWEELKFKTGKKLNEELNDNSFNSALDRLLAYSFIEKKDAKFYLSDPLIAKATFLINA